MEKKLLAKSGFANAIDRAVSTVDYYVRIGVANPDRDSNNRMLFGQDDVDAVKNYCAKSGRK